MSTINSTINLYKTTCPDFPKSEDKAFQWIISRIKHNTPCSNKRRLTRNAVRESKGVRYEDTLDTYYVQLINDTLDEIRKKRTAYIFSFQQLRDIIKFEPNAKFTYVKNNDCFAVTL